MRILIIPALKRDIKAASSFKQNSKDFKIDWNGFAAPMRAKCTKKKDAKGMKINGWTVTELTNW